MQLAFHLKEAINMRSASYTKFQTLFRIVKATNGEGYSESTDERKVKAYRSFYLLVFYH